MPLAYAQQLAGMRGRVTRVLVQTEPGRRVSRRDARCAASLRDGIDVRADDDARLLAQPRPNDQSTALFAAISALVGLLFAFNAMLLTVPERRR